MGIYEEILRRQGQAVSDQVWDEIEELAPALKGTPRDGFWFYAEETE